MKVKHVFTASNIFEVFKAGVCLYSIFMIHFFSARSKESLGNKNVDSTYLNLSIFAETNLKIWGSSDLRLDNSGCGSIRVHRYSYCPGSHVQRFGNLANAYS